MTLERIDPLPPRTPILAMLALLLLFAPSAGCGARQNEVVQARAASDLSCPKDKLDVQAIGGSSYKATGCGMSATYTCLGGGFANPFEAMCSREGGAAPVSGVTAPQR